MKPCFLTMPDGVKSITQEPGQLERIAIQVGRFVDQKNIEYGETYSRLADVMKAITGKDDPDAPLRAIAYRVIEKLARELNSGPNAENWVDIVGLGLNALKLMGWGEKDDRLGSGTGETTTFPPAAGESNHRK